jgi:hypothetical protein
MRKEEKEENEELRSQISDLRSRSILSEIDSKKYIRHKE